MQRDALRIMEKDGFPDKTIKACVAGKGELMLAEWRNHKDDAPGVFACTCARASVILQRLKRQRRWMWARALSLYASSAEAVSAGCVLFACLRARDGKGAGGEEEKARDGKGQGGRKSRRLGWLQGRWCRFKVSLMGPGKRWMRDGKLSTKDRVMGSSGRGMRGWSLWTFTGGARRSLGASSFGACMLDAERSGGTG